MRTSENGLQLITAHEGFRSKPYLCPAGVPTIGYGSTFYPDGCKVTLQDKPVTEAEATDIMRNVVAKVKEPMVHKLGKLNQNQFDAMVSFVYNVKLGQFNTSTIRRKILANPSDPSIADEFPRWKYGGGKVLPGLVKRRKEEAKLYFT